MEETYYLERRHNGVYIDNTLINESIFDEEKIDYSVVYREDLIDNLIDWISEATNDKYMMKEDLKYLMNLNDELIFTSISTNEYICKSDNEKEFNKICKQILNLNNGV